jgi:protein SCO1
MSIHIPHIPTPRRAFVLLSMFVLLLASCGREAAPAVATLGVPDPSTLPKPETVWTIDPPRPLTDWTLPASTGQSMSLHDFRGRFMLLFFGFNNCRDVCPTTLGEFKKVKQQLGEAASDVSFVYVSVDGERDTPQLLAKYVQLFDPEFVGISGTFETLAPVAQEYALFARKPGRIEERENYLVEHTTVSYLVDREGRLQTIYGFGTPPAKIVEDIKRRSAQG